MNNLKESFSKVVGHEAQKEEILSVVNWFENSQELIKKGVTIPKGFILYGPPGCGKSMIIKTIIENIDSHVFVFKGENKDVLSEVSNIFKKARMAKKAVIVFDELDLLIDKDKRIIRSLQESLDGVESYDNLLVIAATNDIDEIPAPLLRSGRIEKIFNLSFPLPKEAVRLFYMCTNEFNLKLPDDFDEEEVSHNLLGLTYAGIKAVVNDLILRNGFDNISMEMIDNSINNITERVKETYIGSNINIAVHEASHAVVAHQFQNYFKIGKLSLSNNGGSFLAKDTEFRFSPFEKVIAHIKVSMAGILGEKVICGTGSIGSESDLQDARKRAYNLFNISGYSSCWETLPTVSNFSRVETQLKRRRMERKIEKLLKKCEKETVKIIKKNKDKIILLANKLLEKKRMKSTEILDCLLSNNAI